MQQIHAMASRIKAGLNCRVILFGSHAWGRPHACSDVDLAIIVPDDSQIRHPGRMAARLSLHGLLPIDTIHCRESTLAAAGRGSLLHEVRMRGVEL